MGRNVSTFVDETSDAVRWRRVVDDNGRARTGGNHGGRPRERVHGAQLGLQAYMTTCVRRIGGIQHDAAFSFVKPKSRPLWLFS